MKIVGAWKRVVRFLAVAVCAAASACTSAGNDPAISDAGAGGTTATGTAATGADAAIGDAGADVSACVSLPVSVATVDAGDLFGCYQTACAAELGACAADCVCNGAIMSALQCLLADAGSVQSCFYPPILRNAAVLPVRTAGTCLQLILSDGGCERIAAQTESSGDAAGEGSDDATGSAGDESDGGEAPASD